MIITCPNCIKQFKIDNSLIPMNKYLFRVAKYKSASPELLINKAIIAANNNTSPLAASNLKNHLKGLDI